MITNQGRRKPEKNFEFSPLLPDPGNAGVGRLCLRILEVNRANIIILPCVEINAGIFCCIGNVVSRKQNVPRGLHCDGYENVAKGTKPRWRISLCKILCLCIEKLMRSYVLVTNCKRYLYGMLCYKKPIVM